MANEPRLEIDVTERGVRSVRVFGDGWEQSQRALSLLRKVEPVVQALDRAAKESEGPVNNQPERRTQ